ncbi:MAG: hypothetical protein ABII80_01905 [bacterium]
MTDQHIQSLQALSQDLYRVAIGRHRGQTEMSIRFANEAKARLAELSSFNLADKIMYSLNSKAERSAEDLLMYSTLVRNITLRR